LCWVSDLVSEGVSSALAGFNLLERSDLGKDSIKRFRLIRSGTLKNRNGPLGDDRSWCLGEERYRNARRYPAGVMPVARRNARVKLDCEENWQSRAISWRDARPVAIIALAFSSRRRLT
jgi:hypothetical protein